MPTATTHFKFSRREVLQAAQRGAGPVEAALADQRFQQGQQEEMIVERVYKVLSVLLGSLLGSLLRSGHPPPFPPHHSPTKPTNPQIATQHTAHRCS